MRLLQRYVLMELLRVFLLTLTGLTIMMTFVGVIAEATRSGLGPDMIIQVLPFIVPSLMPFTIPATLLLTVTVVYGRLSGDQEITAIKAAGINVMAIIMPSIIMGFVLSIGTFLLTNQFIPWAKENIRQIVASGMEDIFLDVLRTQHTFSDKKMGITISVSSIEDRKLIKPQIRFKSGAGGAVLIGAQEATISFDLKNDLIKVRMLNGQVQSQGSTTTVFGEENRSFPLPREVSDKHPRDITISQIYRELDRERAERDAEENQRLIETAFALTQGHFENLSTEDFQPGAWQDIYAQRRVGKLKTEIHSRYALACSCFFFVLLGSSFSIYHGRSQFLTNFFVCFMPVLLVYYPVVLLMMTLSKNETVNPIWAMWVGNAVLLAAGVYILRKVLQH